MSFANLRIRTRILVGFAIIILGSLLMALYASYELKGLGQSVKVLAEDRMLKIKQTNDLVDNVNLVARGLRNMALVQDATIKAAEKKRIDEASAANTRIYEALDRSIQSAQGRQLLKTAEDARAQYRTALAKSIQLAEGTDQAATTSHLLGEMRQAQANYFKALDGLIKFQEGLAIEDARNAERIANTDAMLLLGLALVSSVAAALIGGLVARSITRPVDEAVRLAQAVAAGDLTTRIDAHSNDETGQLLRALKTMNDNLLQMIGSVRHASDSIATGATQVAAGSQDLSQRTEEQAANLEETAASLEQLTSTVTQSAETARQANQLAQQTAHAAANGGQVVGQVVQTMSQITQSSRKMHEIIGVIDGIAFQTNILALNAAVEAARAGELGRGFAVVAGEVRSLAQRSAEAAREIKQLIQTSIDSVDNGSTLVDQAGKAMEDIVVQVQRVTDLIGEMSSATSEQTGGIQQINTAVAQMDQMTQQNAALVEESSAAADSLKHQAIDLQAAVAGFNTGTQATPGRAAPLRLTR